MASKLIHVGNSRALIIPAKMIRDLGIDDDTLLELTSENGGIFVKKKPRTIKDLNLPKLDKLPDISEELMRLGEGVSFTEEDWKNDERLEHILRKCGYI